MKRTFRRDRQATIGSFAGSIPGRYVIAALIALPPFAGIAQEPVPGPHPTPVPAVSTPDSTTSPDDLPGAQPTPSPVGEPGRADGAADRPSGLFPTNASDPSASPASDLTGQQATNPFTRVIPSASPASNLTGQQSTNPFTRINPAVQIVSTISQQGLSNGESLFSGLGGVPNPLSARYLSSSFDQHLGFILGPAWVLPSLAVGSVYRLQRGGAADGNYEDVYATITPSVALSLGTPEAGRTLTLQYQGVISIGQTEGMGSYDQTLQINTAYTFTKLTLGVGLQASQLSGSDQDFSGDNANRLLLALSGHASYQYSEITSIDFTLTTPIRLYQQGNSSEGVTSQTFINYVYSPLTTVGVGFGLGTLAVDGNTQVFEQILLRLGYSPTPKFSMDTTFGYEFRQIGGTTENTPIFRLGITWRPQDETSLALSGERSVFNSAALSGSNYTTTSVSLTASQRVGRYAEVSGTVGYNDDSYQGAGGGNDYGRDTQYFLFQAGVSFQLNRQLRLLVNADYSQLDSSGGVPSTTANSKNKGSSYGLTTGNLRVFETSVQINYEF